MTTEYSEELETAQVSKAGRLMKAGSVPPIVYNCEALRNEPQQPGNKREKLQNEPKVSVAGREKATFLTVCVEDFQLRSLLIS